MRRPTTTESETHVVLFTAGFFGRGFDSRRLHHHFYLCFHLVNSLLFFVYLWCTLRQFERHRIFAPASPYVGL
jgi:hypothetical protein